MAVGDAPQRPRRLSIPAKSVRSFLPSAFLKDKPIVSCTLRTGMRPSHPIHRLIETRSAEFAAQPNARAPDAGMRRTVNFHNLSAG
jgi:hypothetical protein